MCVYTCTFIYMSHISELPYREVKVLRSLCLYFQINEEFPLKLMNTPLHHDAIYSRTDCVYHVMIHLNIRELNL